jgi:hypothetical protein
MVLDALRGSALTISIGEPREYQVRMAAAK